MLQHGIPLAIEIRGRVEVQAFEAGRCHRHGALQFAQLYRGIGDHDIHQVDAPS
jgi:hypothetical protein